ncbi:MAG: insulinase family protein [Litorimonas sp.]
MIRFKSIYPFVITGLILTACQGQVSKPTDPIYFAHQASDLPSDPDIEYGRLPNGVRYAVRHNETPTKTASLLMRIDTGSLNETDETRGIAHFLEHMAFNGSENIPENEMTKRLEKFGLAFGADTNASTGFESTSYQLELPEVSDEIFEETLMIMRETASRLTLAPDAIDRERGIILAEKRARNSPAFQSLLDGLEFYLGQTVIPKRLPIGTEETIGSVTAEQFEAFYRGYYRPENAFITLVGDFETSYAIEKIEKFFGDWEAQGEALPKYEIKDFQNDEPRFRYYTNPEIQTSVSVSVVSPFEEKEDTADNRFDSVIEGLGNSILNRRFGKIARSGAANFIGASVSTSSLYQAAEISSLSVSAEPESWEPAFAQAEQTLRQALKFGFTQAELDEQLANYRKGLEVSVQTSPTRRTPGLARGIMGAFGGEYVITTPQSTFERYVAREDEITLEKVEASFREAWKDLAKRPQIYMSTPAIIENAEEKLQQAYERSQAVSIEPRAEDVVTKFAYTDFGPAGKVRKRGEVEDIEITTVEFENNVRLNIKKTDYEKDVIRIRARMGSGNLTFPEDRGFGSYIQTVLGLSGLEAHTVDDIATIMAGKTVRASTGIGSERMSIGGATVPENLDDQLNLMTAYVTSQAFREEPIAQWEKSVRSFYPTLDSTPGGVAGRDIPALIRSGNPRYRYPSEAELLDVDLDLIRGWMDEHVKDSAIEVSVVGDVDIEEIITAVGRTFGALPTRAAAFTEVPDDADVKVNVFPKGQVRPFKLTHSGDAETALLRIYWPTPKGYDILKSRQIGMITQLMRLRLTEELREEEGASYSPSAFASTSRVFKDYGYVGVSLELSPEEIDVMTEKVETIAAEFKAGDFDAELFERAIKPTLENIETSLESNNYWMGVIDSVQTTDRDMNNHRTRQEVYQNMTVDDLKPLTSSIFNASDAIRIQVLPVQ